MLNRPFCQARRLLEAEIIGPTAYSIGLGPTGSTGKSASGEKNFTGWQ
jgi:hypothetical protein